MSNYLEDLCLNLNINLVYTNNKFTILSVTTSNDKPTIRAHNIFKNCPKKVAKSIVEYYTSSNLNKENLNLLTKFIEKNFSSKEYKIKPPSQTFMNLIIKNLNTTPSTKRHINSTNNSESLIEYNITHIKKKNFYGDVSTLDPDETIKTTEKDIIELDIVVNGVNTK